MLTCHVQLWRHRCVFWRRIRKRQLVVLQFFRFKPGESDRLSPRILQCTPVVVIASCYALMIEPFKFPRVKLFLDSDDLKISDDCLALLDKIKEHKRPKDVTKFRTKYGRLFNFILCTGDIDVEP